MNICTLFQNLQKASRVLENSSADTRNQFLKNLAEKLRKQMPAILAENERDLRKMENTNPLFDRLQLTKARITAMAQDVEKIALLPDPLGMILEQRDRPTGIHLKKITVPLGCIGVIYESRPNVTIDVSSLCIKSGNAALLRGGTDAFHSNQFLIQMVQAALVASGLPKNAVQLLPKNRKYIREMLCADRFLDVIIPRGGKSLIDLVRKTSRVPVIETGASVVHTVVDDSASIEMAANIIWNEKTRRPAVCNAVDTILVHQKIASLFLPVLAKTMLPSKTVFHTDSAVLKMLRDHYPSDLLIPDAAKHFYHEFLSLQMNVVLVKNFDQALEHIRKYSLKHSESLITSNPKNAKRFEQEVDAACVYINTSTAFSDGGEFGMGAEIGISTQKLHARGPIGLQDLTSYKWLVRSEGAVRR